MKRLATKDQLRQLYMRTTRIASGISSIRKTPPLHRLLEFIIHASRNRFSEPKLVLLTSTQPDYVGMAWILNNKISLLPVDGAVLSLSSGRGAEWCPDPYGECSFSVQKGHFLFGIFMRVHNQVQVEY